jgi:adenylate kinase
MGPPGAGKGTQATDLSTNIGGAHISTGDIFRQNVAEETDLGREAKKYMDAGQYVPDEITNGMVRARLAQPDAESFVLDGYPRTADQVAELDDILASLGAKLDAVISLVVADREELVQRMIKRAATSGRADDTEDVIRHRQDVYDAETAALIPIYSARGILHEVDGVGTIEQVEARVAEVVRELEHA